MNDSTSIKRPKIQMFNLSFNIEKKRPKNRTETTKSKNVHSSKMEQVKALRKRSNAEIKAYTEALATELDENLRNEALDWLLGCIYRLIPYSFNNTRLILLQRPYARAVKTKINWEKVGRRVKEGESPLLIWAPCGSKGFPWKPMDVFDLEQTEGDDFELPARNATVCDRLPQVEAAAPRLGLRIGDGREIMHGGPIEQSYVIIGQLKDGVVFAHPGLSELARIGTLIHEYAHHIMHKDIKCITSNDYYLREVEAESVSYVVIKALDLGDTPRRDPSWAYIAKCGFNGNSILKIIKRISAASNAILIAIHGQKPNIRIPVLKKKD